MRNIRSLTATAVLTIAALSTTSAIASADPAPGAQPSIGYESHVVGGSIVTTLQDGLFTVAADERTVDITSVSGEKVLTLPLTYQLDHVSLPLAHAVTNGGATLQLTPSAPEVKPSLPLDVHLVASLLENQRAQESFFTQFGIATAIGSFIGTAIGAVIGAVIGAAACVTIVACLPGIVLGAGVGAIIGTFVVGGPVLVIAGIDLVQTLTAPPGTTKWNYSSQPTG